ncbi:MAG: hypothetical protein KA099_02945 [Alphaproteobacteria bacterium]|nr:hypothetical protein [Alphaproteobacteria bacterium]MBP7759300.1 hypothetical protein [Alphaproteobacteria bacterium]MBP7762513.1 hypothetical protein [Alphaproteobacteria bacterium]MBP7904260.1 hypothetical protein [Alphaproteobacteria bacterium]
MLTITDIKKLLALHRFIAETKFVACMDNPVGDGAGYIAEIAKDNLQAIIEFYEHNNKQEESNAWKEWMILTKKSVAYDRIAERIKLHDRWHSFDEERRKKYCWIGRRLMKLATACWQKC